MKLLSDNEIETAKLIWTQYNKIKTVYKDASYKTNRLLRVLEKEALIEYNNLNDDTTPYWVFRKDYIENCAEFREYLYAENLINNMLKIASDCMKRI